MCVDTNFAASDLPTFYNSNNKSDQSQNAGLCTKAVDQRPQELYCRVSVQQQHSFGFSNSSWCYSFRTCTYAISQFIIWLNLFSGFQVR